ncbi:MAG: SsrA-binding protein SmpB, partial [Bacteroidetes bacterium]
MSNSVNIKNKKAFFNYEILEKYEAGLQLTGTEIKSIRNGKAGINEAYCYFKNGELFVKNMYIAEYEQGTFYNHEPRRERKLLLHKKELRKLEKKLEQKGLTIIPLRLYINKRGWAKLEIGLAKGKKLYDKRETIKERDIKRDLGRKLKN